ncbi:DNA primase [Shouchella shacheensis]|uniref:DNA primase n=1 Tax=Shouchella shacheensis TaxID=1649580 RepID=UPI00073FD459|nr:DNA primase [Shouchella shacheensis]
MTYRIPEDTLAEVRQATDIVDVISDYVQLKKQGGGYGGLCPFHGENTPSFSVSPKKQLYHCFGCGAGGNVFTFLQDLEGWSFVETVQTLASRAQIELPEVPSGNQQTNEKNELNRQMKQGHELAASMYRDIMQFTQEGAAGRVYAEERQFSEELIEVFQIGFAPDKWEALATILEKNRLDLSVMEEAGLIVNRKNAGGYYDLFRSRLMFPICDGKGNVIAFSGRLIGEGQPKYLNTPETPIFQKNKTLFNLHLARPSIRKRNQAVLFEGAVDAMSAWGAEIKNAVATLGTALSETHAKVLRRNAEEVILCYDGDKAGNEAARKAIPILEQAGCEVRVALLTEGFDPDDFVHKFGPEQFRKQVYDDALPSMSFTMQQLRQGKNLQNEGERLNYIEEVLKHIAGRPRDLEREHYLRRLAEEFSLSLDALKQELSRLRSEERGRQVRNKQHRSNAATAKKGYSANRPAPAHIKAERILLTYMLQDIEMVWRVSEQLTEAFNVDEHQALYAYMLTYYSREEEGSAEQFIERLEDRQLAKLAAELSMQDVKEDCSEEELADYIKRIEQYPKWVRIEEQQREAIKEQDPVKMAQLLQRKNELSM